MSDIIDNLLAGRRLAPEAVARVQAAIAEGMAPDQALVESGVMPEDELLSFLAEEFGVGRVDLESRSPSRDFLAAFPARVLFKHRLLPLSIQEDGSVLVAVSRLFETAGLDELRLLVGRELRTVLASRVEIERCLKRDLGVGADTVQSLVSDADAAVEVLDQESDDTMDLSEAAADASIVRLVNEILLEALESRATDVHFEPFENELRVRYRVDGVLKDAAVPLAARRFQAAIISRLKILAHLDIAEKRLPQDGRIKLRIAGREMDIRVSVIPMLYGEGVVLRLLDREAALIGLESLGMADSDCAVFQRVLGLPHGIVLVTGPTGSGKTTTLYAALSRINDVERKIVTIEDPIEYQLRGINQIPVSGKTGLTFARGLRSILRHDPDVILIGEIRDRETADIAVQASLTGHLVFSTLHTNDAPGTPTRLIDMGVEPYLVASSLEAVVAQRLVRLICPDCREALPAAEAERACRQHGLEDLRTLYRGIGCRQCQNTGYRGRTGIFELMMVGDPMRNLILERASAQALRELAEARGMNSLRRDGWRLVLAGRTTVEELLRVTKDEPGNGNGNGLAADH